MNQKFLNNDDFEVQVPVFEWDYSLSRQCLGVFFSCAHYNTNFFLNILFLLFLVME